VFMNARKLEAAINSEKNINGYKNFQIRDAICQDCQEQGLFQALPG